jgi:hypothetical protein
MSGSGGKADVLRRPSECLFIAISRLSLLLKSNRTLAHRDAGGGSRPQHQELNYKSVLEIRAGGWGRICGRMPSLLPSSVLGEPSGHSVFKL